MTPWASACMHESTRQWTSLVQSRMQQPVERHHRPALLLLWYAGQQMPDKELIGLARHGEQLSGVVTGAFWHCSTI